MAGVDYPNVTKADIDPNPPGPIDPPSFLELLKLIIIILVVIVVLLLVGIGVFVMLTIVNSKSKVT
jgi:hypothetical protein